jgi:hypothetical protein
MSSKADRSERILSPEGDAAPPSVTLSPSRWRRVARRNKTEVLLHMLAERGRARQRSRSSPKAAGPHWSHLQQAKVVGIGYGVKETEGGFTGELAVRLYVKRKIARSKLSPRDRVPPVVNGIVTDVIPVGRLTFHARPVPFGVAISHAHGKAGSLGCVVSRPGDDARYLLSACHVLAPLGNAQVGDEILEPEAGRPEALRIATLTEFEQLKSEAEPNRFDAAIARLDQNADVSARIAIIGELRTPVMSSVPFQSVRKYGAATHHTLGVVTDPLADVPFTMDGDEYPFEDVIEVLGAGGPFSAGGDSGALVVDALTNRPIGLIIGGARGRTYVSPLTRVLEHFNVQLVA